MPTLKERITVDREIDFEIYCGVCGNGISADAVVDHQNNVTVHCFNCKDKMEQLEKKIALYESSARDAGI